MLTESAKQFALPIYIDLSATFLYGVTGALVAINRKYDIVGVFVLALVTGVGGGLIRDGIFIQNGPPAVMTDSRYLTVILVSCFVAAIFTTRMTHLRGAFLWADALGVGAYAVVGVARSFGAGLGIVAAILVGVVNAVGGGLLRDVMVGEEPLLFKPGQLYVLAALLAAVVFTFIVVRHEMSTEKAALLAIACAFVFRALAMVFNWKTISVSEGLFPISHDHSDPPS